MDPLNAIQPLNPLNAICLQSIDYSLQIVEIV